MKGFVSTLADTVRQDLRYGIRMMRRGPMFAVTAVATVALSTAAIATVATLADTLLWRQLPVDDAHTLVSITATRGHLRTDGAISYPDYVAFRDRATTVSPLAAHYSTAPLFVAVAGNAAEVNGAVVSANYFPLFEMRPVLGRFFRADEDRVPDRDRVAVIGYDFWQSWFSGSPEAVGSGMTINGVRFTVIGIAPPQPVALTPMPVNLYIPTMMLRVGYRWCNDSLDADCTTLTMIGRLSGGRTVPEAAAEFAAIMPAAWTHAPPGENSGVVVRQPRGMSEDDQEPRVIAMLAAVAAVLLIVCCANLGGLLSAQSAAREGEFAIRLAVGAAPLRIMRGSRSSSDMPRGWRTDHATVFSGRRVRPGRRHDRRKLRRGLRNGASSRQPADHRQRRAVGVEQVVAPPIPDAQHHRRDIQIHGHWGQGDGLRRCNADDGEPNAVDRHSRADGFGTAAEPRLPEVVSNDRDAVAIGHSILIGAEEAAEHRAHLEKRKVIRRNDRAVDLGRIARDGDEERRGRIVRGERAHRGRPIAKRDVVEGMKSRRQSEDGRALPVIETRVCASSTGSCRQSSVSARVATVAIAAVERATVATAVTAEHRTSSHHPDAVAQVLTYRVRQRLHHEAFHGWPDSSTTRAFT